MKRIVSYLLAVLTIGVIASAYCFASATEIPVNVSIPSFTIKINGGVVENNRAMYPCIIYSNITYFPMTYSDSRALGITADFSPENGLIIKKTGTPPYIPRFEQGTAENTDDIATFAQGIIAVNGKSINNSEEEYPLLLYRNVTYFPLTWRFAVEEFGWTYDYTAENGLSIAVTGRERNLAPENAEVFKCGNELLWRFDAYSSTLYVEGQGDMWDFSVWDESVGEYVATATPWAAHNGSIKKVVIGKGVTSIGDNAFNAKQHISTINSVEISNTVKSIGEKAFYFCDVLNYLKIPTGLESIYDMAFANCSSLAEAEIPNSVTHIGNMVFADCSSLKTILFKGTNDQWLATGITPDSVKNANVVLWRKSDPRPSGPNPNACGDNATWRFNVKNATLYIEGTGGIWDYKKPAGYYVEGPGWLSKHFNSIRKIVISDGITSIGNYAFFNLKDVTSVTIPDSVTVIGAGAFANLSITELKLPKNLLRIDDSAFEKTKITSLELPDTLVSIGNSAFAATPIESFKIPESVIEIGDSAFFRTSIKELKLPEKLLRLGEDTFANCNQISGTIDIPAGLLSMSSSTFRNCERLSAIAVNPENVYYCDKDGILFSKSMNKILTVPCGKNLTEYTIPESVTSIHDYAFSGCKLLASVIIPNSVTSIGQSAFYGCVSLSDAKLPESVTSIGDYAFSNCDSFVSVDLPQRVTNIGAYAFSFCDSIVNMEIPQSVTNIGDHAFAYCKSLTEIKIPGSVTSIGGYVLDSCDSLKKIHFTGSKEQWLRFNLDSDDLGKAAVIFGE